MFEHVGQIYTGSHGINATYTSRTIIEHNEFVHLPYNAISVGWGWTDLETSLRDNRIQYNLIHDVMQLHDDSAGIYTLSYQPGTTITENWIHDLNRSEWAEQFGIGGIYLDEGSRGIRVERNVLMNVPEMIHLNTIRENLLIDNYHQYDWVKTFAGIQPYLKVKTYPDVEAPTLIVALSPNELKAPNHKMVTYTGCVNAARQ